MLVKLYCRVAIALVFALAGRLLANYFIERAPSFQNLIESAFALIVGIGTVAYVFLPLFPKNSGDNSQASSLRYQPNLNAPTSNAAQLPALRVGELTHGKAMLRVLEITRLVWMLGLAAFAATVFIAHDLSYELVATLPVLAAGFVESIVGYLRPDLARAKSRSSVQAVLSDVSPYRKGLHSNGHRLGFCIFMGAVFFGALGLTVFRFWH
jgi:hypothetical protein